MTTEQTRVPIPVGITITSPRDGLRLSPEDPPVIIVEGRVTDTSASKVWLAVNDRRIAVPASEGRFRQVLPVLEATLRLCAETEPIDGRPRQSATVTVHAAANPSALAILMNWPRETVTKIAEIVGSWRSDPTRVDARAQPFSLRPADVPVDGVPTEVFYLRNPKAGVYTFFVRYSGAAPTEAARPMLYVAHAGMLNVNALGPLVLDGTGKGFLGKILMPYGVRWNQDDWFTGQSSGGDSVTKFRFPEGVSWTERSADLR